MNIHELINRDIHCTCGKVHRCDIEALEIGVNVLQNLPKHLRNYKKVLLVCDQNTYPLAGDPIREMLGSKLESICLFHTEGYLVPNEQSVAVIEKQLTDETDFILGLGSGVINDLCKFVSFYHGMRCGIVATAPSMDGYASSGAAMILGGMKVTHTTHAPALILGDVGLLQTAPMEMVRGGYADIIGKYSALSDWKLGQLIFGEHFCPFLYDVVKQTTDEVCSLAKPIAAREETAIAKLMEALVLVGAAMALFGSTRPASGSEHHFSHYFEITGLIHDAPYFLHGVDVGYSTYVTALMRNRILQLEQPAFSREDPQLRNACCEAIYGSFAGDVLAIQEKAGLYEMDLTGAYEAHWDEIRQILLDARSPQEILQMLTDVGMDYSEFEKLYGVEKIHAGTLFAKDLKERYSFLWLYYDLFFTREAGQRICEK